MQPGRELDLLVATKVMGESLEYNSPPYGNTVPMYSTNIGAAETIVNKLRDKWNMTLTDKTAVWMIRFKEDGWSDGAIVDGFGITIAHAICEAALNTAGIKV